LSEAFGGNALGVSAIVGMFYYGYSPFSLVAGTSMDRFGAKRVIPIGAAVVGIGALFFGTGNATLPKIGRFLEGAGGAFALIGAVYLITKNFPASVGASLIGATQMFGMAGGSAGQFFVGPIIKGGVSWDRFWIYAGCLGLVISVVLLILLPKETSKTTTSESGAFATLLRSLGKVFRNPQFIICGFLSGLIFFPH